MGKCAIGCILICLSLTGFAQTTKTLDPSEIAKLLPSKIKPYRVENSKSRLLEIGSLRYSLSEKKFLSREKSIKVLLFDYVEAPVMFNQSIKKWQQMPETKNDSIAFSAFSTQYGEVWESEHSHYKRSKLVLSINNRFFMTLEAENVLLPELRKFFQNFNFGKFPK